MTVGALPVNNVPNREWVKEHVYWLWGIYLEEFQMDILMDLLGGGILSVLLPTDHGKSTLLKMSVVLSLILNPKQPNIVIKISREAAREALTSICFTLVRASEMYPYVKPMVRWNRTTRMPITGHQFMIDGGDFDRTDNPSVYAASIWEADMQGRRGRAHVDDIETEREARYILYRERLEGRVDSVLRTIEDADLFLMALFGTPQHGESVYFKIVDRLSRLGQRYKVIRLPWKDPETGKLLFPRRASKVEIHRRTMTPWAFKVAYDLEPTRSGRASHEDIEKSKDKGYTFCRTRRIFEEWFRQNYDKADALLTRAHYYVGWDPSAEHDFALAAEVFIGEEMFLLDAIMEPGDVFDQVAQAADLWQRYDKPTVVIERNAQQKSFRDVLTQRLPYDADIQMHQTTKDLHSDKIGIPFMLNLLRQGWFHMPYSDNLGQNISDYLVVELENYGPMAHPHLLPAIWFPFHWHRKYASVTPMKRLHQEPKPAFEILPLQLSRAAAAWGRGRR